MWENIQKFSALKPFLVAFWSAFSREKLEGSFIREFIRINTVINFLSFVGQESMRKKKEERKIVMLKNIITLIQRFCM